MIEKTDIFRNCVVSLLLLEENLLLKKNSV